MGMHTTPWPVRRLVRTYYLFSFFGDFALVYPVYAILFREQGLDYGQISLLFAIWSGAVLLVEIPSGILADRWSRKWSLVTGMMFKAAGFLVWLVRPDFAGFAVGFVLWGLQEALCSGTTEAFLYDALAQHSASQRFVRTAGRGSAMGRAGIILSLLLGAWTYSRLPTLVLVISAIAMLVAGLCAASFPDVRAVRGKAPHQGLVAQIREAALVPGLLVLVVFGSLAAAVYGVLDEYDSLLARDFGVPLALIGVWGTIRFGMEALGAELSEKITRRLTLDRLRRHAVWLLVAAVALFLSVYRLRAAVLPLYFIFYFMLSSSEVIMQGWIHTRIASEGRATIGSVVSFVYEALGLLILLSAVPAATAGGLRAVFIGGAALSGLSAVALFVAASRTGDAA
ncbi:MAG: MFS transporter [Spirochaetaceae bacterium]|nr:MAG: MFS transporter [Spirochaetaceae bacterium]